MKLQATKRRYVICLRTDGADDLELRKLYEVIRVPEAELCVIVLGNVQPVASGPIAAQLAGMVLEGR